MRSLFLIPLLLIGFVIRTNAQSLPSTQFNFDEHYYTLTEWSADAPAGTYPPNMVFHTASKRDPLLSDTMSGDWNLAYNLTSDSRILGLGEGGICFANTSNASADGGYMGAAVWAVRIPNPENELVLYWAIHISWLGVTIDTASRRYGIALQYSLDTGKTYIDLDVPYIQEDLPGASYPNTSVLDLDNPPETISERVVLLRWKYFYYDGESGKRSRLAIDDISIFCDKVMLSADDATSVDPIAYYSASANSLVLRDGQMPTDIALYSTLGECVYRTATQPGEQIVRLPELPSGAYFAKLARGSKSSSISIVVAR